MEDYKEALRFIDRNCTAWGKENQDEFIKATRRTVRQQKRKTAFDL